MAISKEDVKAYLSGLNILELAGLIKELEEAWGVKAAAAAVAVAAPAAGPAAPAAPVEEKVDFTVILTKAGDERVKTIKVVREVTGLGLVEAKNLVEALPKEIKANVPKDEAESIKKKFAEVGAAVDIK